MHGVTEADPINGTILVRFFFSSRRRQTRLQGDWSSDVCSSDLAVVVEKWAGQLTFGLYASHGYVEQRLPDRHLRVQDFASHDFVGQDLATGRQDASNQWLADRKSTRLNSSHLVISYAVFCLKKKKKHHM